MLILRTAFGICATAACFVASWSLAHVALGGEAAPAMSYLDGWRAGFEALIAAPFVVMLGAVAGLAGIVVFFAAVWAEFLRPEPGEYWRDPESWGDR